MLFWCSTLCRDTMRCSNPVGRTRYLIEIICCLGYEVVFCFVWRYLIVVARTRKLIEIIPWRWSWNYILSKDILVSCPKISSWNFIFSWYVHPVEQSNGRTRNLVEIISCLGYEVEILFCLKISLVQRYLVEIWSCLDMYIHLNREMVG